MTTIVLGTVQLGLAYGRRRDLAPPDDAKVDRILDAAWDRGIRCFDTARAYGNAPERLARHLGERGRLADAHVVMKLTEAELADPVAVDSLDLFSHTASLALLSHSAPTDEAWATLTAVAERHGIDAGQSVYTADEVHRAASMGAARVQAPANVLDLRCVRAAAAADVPIDVRSVFLQGLLLDAPAQADQRFPGARRLADGIAAAARQAGGDPVALLIAAVAMALGDDDRLVLGVDDPDQLAPVFDDAPDAATLAAFTAAVAPTRALTQDDPRMLDPRTWPSMAAATEAEAHQ